MRMAVSIFCLVATIATAIAAFTILARGAPEPSMELHRARVSGTEERRVQLEEHLERQKWTRKALIGGLFAATVLFAAGAFLTLGGSRASFVRVVLLLSLCGVLCDCRRKDYREHADKQSYAALLHKTAGTPWEVPAEFSIDPDPRSRLFDPSDPDFPSLPRPDRLLDSYELPELVRAAARIEIRAGESADEEAIEGLRIHPIPPDYWDALPRACLARMLEVESVVEEYRLAYEEEPPETLLDAAPRLSLANIVELALLNSREYQTRKEILYRAALALTLERFEFVPQFSPFGNGVDADYTITRSPATGGDRVESSSIGSGAAGEALLATGGTAIARFANDIVLTFDGPGGWSKEISSELLFELSQSLFQRDVRLNPLVQSERDLVYAARDFARFRKEFFFQFANQYYGLLREYRGIEIEAQNYFSLVRTFRQAQAEVGLGVQRSTTPVEADQFEQSMLSGRSDLISTCNRLERALDSLKLSMGIPTETPINLDLSELQLLTLRNQIEVTGERARRWRARVLERRQRDNPNRDEVLNGNIFLLERLLEWVRLRWRLGFEVEQRAALELSLALARVDLARAEHVRALAALAEVRDSELPVPIILIFQRTRDVVATLFRVAELQIPLALARGRTADEVEPLGERRAALFARDAALGERVAEVLRDLQSDDLSGLVNDVEGIRTELEALIGELDQLAERDPARENLETTLAETDLLVATLDALFEGAELGLAPVDISARDAMRTALVQRLDLMNERWRLADDRRDVKIAADDLKSVLDLNASHSIGSRDRKPLKFTSHDSQTRLSLSFDLPLNRRSQRNVYRRALIDYHAGRRSLMELEDAIKFDIRDGLRTLEETRIQYPIAVTQAGLAAEQVISVQLQLTLGFERVRGTDLLDALQSSRRALISVANARIGYLVDRAQFALDLELMEIDSAGMWTAIDDPSYRPEPNVAYPENAGPAYGDIPKYVFVSREIRSMLRDHPVPGETRAANQDEDRSAAESRAVATDVPAETPDGADAAVAEEPAGADDEPETTSTEGDGAPAGDSPPLDASEAEESP